MEIWRYQMFSSEIDFTCTVFDWSQYNVSPLMSASEFLYFHDAYPPFIYLQHPCGWMSTLMPKLLKPMSLFFFNLLFKKICMCAKLLQLCLTLWRYGLKPTRFLCPWDSPGKNTEAGCHALLQGIFLTQGSNPHLLCLLHWQVGSFTTNTT